MQVRRYSQHEFPGERLFRLLAEFGAIFKIVLHGFLEGRFDFINGASPSRIIGITFRYQVKRNCLIRHFFKPLWLSGFSLNPVFPLYGKFCS